MLRIVHLDTGMDLRGGQQQLLMLARGLRERGHEQLIVSPEGAALGGRAWEDGFRVFALPAHDVARAHGILQLRQVLCAEAFQILHAHDGKGQTLSWLASLGMDLRRVASRRVTFLPARPLDTRLKYGRTCDAVIAVSTFVRQLLVDAGVTERKIEVIPDGVEIPEALPDGAARDRARAQARLEAQDFVAGHLGGLTLEKGQDVAMQAAALLQESAPQARIILAIAVSPASKAPPRKLSPFRKGRFLSSVCYRNVRFIGPLRNIAEWFAALDLCIMPSLAEGLGSSALLAMAYGLPVVASRVGGLPEIIEDGVTGWLVPPGDPSALAAAITNAAANRQRLHEMGAIARERARKFSSDIMVARTEKLYEKLSH